MTDIMFTRTALTEAAEKAGITAAQARTILERAGVKVEPEKPALPTEPGSAIIATEVRGVTGKWRMMLDMDGDWYAGETIDGLDYHRPRHITAWTPARVVPDGEPIELRDVEAGDRVRVEQDNGDEATFTVTEIRSGFLRSEYNTYLTKDIRTIHLLHREEA